MKTLISFCLALVVFGAAQAQRSTPHFAMNYGFMSPTGNMKQFIRNGHGLALSVLFEAPSHRVATGLEFNWTGYGHTKTTTDFVFPDGTSAPMEMTVTNSFSTLMLNTRLYLAVNGPVRPYASVKAGYTLFRTNLAIFDPDNGDSCEPLESDVLSLDGTFAYGAGGGIRIDASWLFKKVPRGIYYIDLSSNILQGGRVDYLNEDAPDPATMHGGPSRAKEVHADFINTQTQVVHPHHIAYSYNSFVQMMDFRLGMIFNISR
jgi:opacity protein-like surface antigen